MESLYWVFTLRCNDHCDHCYNDSGPQGETLSGEELLRVIPHLPEHLGRVVLSGGEPTAEMDKLVALLLALRERFGAETPLLVQSNGDLLTEAKLDRLLEAGLNRIDIVSVDRFHKNRGAHVAGLRALFQKCGLSEVEDVGKLSRRPGQEFALWGATQDLWIGGNWARGRALANGVAKLDPEHNFCNMWSGALGFLDDGSDQQEIHIQLSRVYPCCPTTLFSLGDAREESVSAILDRAGNDPAFKRLNLGDIYGLGTGVGLSRDFIRARIEALGDVCLWCDEYFAQHDKGFHGASRRALMV